MEGLKVYFCNSCGKEIHESDYGIHISDLGPVAYCAECMDKLH